MHGITYLLPRWDFPRRRDHCFKQLLSEVDDAAPPFCRTMASGEGQGSLVRGLEERVPNTTGGVRGGVCLLR